MAAYFRKSIRQQRKKSSNAIKIIIKTLNIQHFLELASAQLVAHRISNLEVSGLNLSLGVLRQDTCSVAYMLSMMSDIR